MSLLNATTVREVQLNTIHFLSNPVGSGKTKAAIQGIQINNNDCHIFVSPTEVLAEEIKERMKDDLTENCFSSGIHKITSREINSWESVQEKVLTTIRGLRPDETHVLIITTETLRNILPNLSHNDKRRYHVYLDEGIDPLEEIQANTGVLTETLKELIDVCPDTGKFSIRQGGKIRSERIAEGNTHALGDDSALCHVEFQKLAKIMTSKLYDVFGTTGEKSFRAVGMLKPELFDGFISVTMIMAEFEQSPLARYWQHSKGKIFKEFVHSHDLFDTHKEKGPLITIHHVLHQDDNASRSVLEEDLEGQKVIYRVCDVVDQFFDQQDKGYCYNVNSFCQMPMHGNQMPVKCAGLNIWEGYHNVAALSSSLPKPWVKDIVIKLLGVNGREFYRQWRMANTYQTIGRCSLRDRDSFEPITIVVLSADEAKEIEKKFPGSRNMGQLGDLPSIKEYRKNKKGRIQYTQADHKAYSMYRKRQIKNGEPVLAKDVWYKVIRLPNLLARQHA